MYDQEKIQLIKATVARGATDYELELFVHWCEKSGFDPLRKQAYFSIRKTKCPNCKATGRLDGQICPTCDSGYIRVPTFIPGIDGLLSRASEHPNYLGIVGSTVHENDDFAFDAVVQMPVRHVFFAKDRGKVIGAWATVHFRDGRKPFSIWYLMSEYLSVAGPVSGGMPELQLVKSTYSIAIRRAFPDKFSGAYSAEEFGGRIDETTGSLILPPREEAPKPTVEQTIEKYSQPEDQPVTDEFVQGTLRYRPKPGSHTVREVFLNGAWFEAEKQVGPVKAESLEKITYLFSHFKHLENHLKKHFQVGTVSALTWEQLAAMIAHQKEGVADPRWYGSEVEVAQHQPSLKQAYYLPPNNIDDEMVQFLKNVLKLDDPLCLSKLFLPPHNWTWKDKRQPLLNLGEMLANPELPITMDSPEFWDLVKAADVPF